ncbi:Peptidase C48, SUMO/Sentrin/Ubl1 [Artemisia annua]|uniref:Peptidase C48, SUMO/Sentrin/Ubl1 n=1 Tax=Artemisia annua TaxID=35608 RepID=A0A2U1MG54_ARTAN|nr:Peptidase C48, SUMO/Sentrin/Ubl1 [Artemisia annua]
METLAPSLWIDANVVDCWGAILNYEESAKKDPSPKKHAKKDPSPKRHFFLTGCITEAMVKGTIGKDEQWDIFSAEISAHLKNVDASKFLAEIELAFFPIQVSSHFYVVVFNIKKSVTSMIILDNSPQTYVAKYKDACDLLVSIL